ncbi:MAG: cation:proton antiporter, partial [Eggerthellaceae bacterium]|nr:cation:proton antiporter [Eggerthellaceae bacterium]
GYMPAQFISLAVICIIAFICPIISQIIPGKPIPETVFLLLFGALAGPYMLGWIQIDTAITLLSDLGLSFLFLLAGYEINPRNLTGYEGRRGLVTWFVTLVIAFIVVIIWPAFSATKADGIAVAIALTTTAIGTLIPIMEERGITKSHIGQSVLAYGTWGEVLPVLAMTILLSTRVEWVTLVILGIFLVIAFLAAFIPKHAHRIGGKIYDLIGKNADTNSQLVVRIIMVLLVGLTAIASLFDLDIVLGAFAAGFILRYIIPKGNVNMEHKLNAIGYGFFVPLFFIVSGAKIDITAMGDDPALLITFIVLLLLVRALPIYIAMSTEKKARRWPINNRITVAIYCTTALPLIVAVTAVAVSAGAMSQDTASVLVSAGGITVLIMPLIAKFTVRTVDANPVEMVKKIIEHPSEAGTIIRQHTMQSRKREEALREECRGGQIVRGEDGSLMCELTGLNLVNRNINPDQLSEEGKPENGEHPNPHPPQAEPPRTHTGHQNYKHVGKQNKK